MANTNLNLTTLRPTIKVRQRSGALEAVSPVTLKTTLGGGVSQLGQLTDVTLTSVSGDNIIAYSNASSQWVNRTPTSVTSGNTGQVVVANTSNFDYTVRLANTVTVNNLVVADTLTVANLQAASLSYTDLSVSGNLAVGGTTTSNNLVVSRNLTANGITSTGNVALTGGTLDVSAVTTFAADVTINANLTVTGNTTYINTTELNIGDNLITLNADVTGVTEPTQNAGIIINRGAQTNAQFIWDETADRFQVPDLKVTSSLVMPTGLVFEGLLDGVTNTSVTYGITANTGRTLDLRITEAYNNAAYLASNATYLATGLVNNALLNAANTTLAGIVRLTDTVTNTSITVAPTANAVKTAYDAAIAANTLANTALSKVNGGTVNGAVVFANTVNITGQANVANVNISGKLTVTVPTGGGSHIIDGNVNFSSNSLFVDTTNKRIGIATDVTTAPLTIGEGGATLTTPLVQITDTSNTYIQVAIQNLSNGASASADYVITADNGTDITNYVDLGKASSGYNYPDFSFIEPLDSYLLNLGGNLDIAQGDTGQIRFFVGGTANTDRKMTLTSSGSNTLTVNGTVTATNLYGNISGDFVTSGTVAAARLPAANTTAAGAVQLVDSVTSTSITLAATANSVKRAYDLAANAVSNATSFADTAYANAVVYANTMAAQAYANALIFAANASNFDSGTLPAGRLPAFDGDVTSSAGDTTLTLAGTGVVANTYGNTTAVAVFTVNAKGQLTNASSVPFAVVNGASYAITNNTLSVTASDGNTFNAVITGANNFSVTGALTMNALSNGSVLFLNGGGQVVSGNATNFRYIDNAVDTFSNTKFTVGPRADATSTDTINITYQIDSYVPNSGTDDSTIGKTSGFTVSTSRGTEASPSVSQSGDFIGQYTGYAYTGGTPAFTEMAGWKFTANGSTSSLGGVAKLYTKKDDGVSTLALSVDEAQRLNVAGSVKVSNTADTSGVSTGSITTAGGLGVTKQLYVGANATVNGTATFNGNVVVSGNLVVTGITTSINVATLNVHDSVVQVAANNVADTVDMGLVGQYDPGTGNSQTGFIRDSVTKKWYLFEGYTGDVTSNAINPADSSFAAAAFVSGNIQITSTTSATNATTGALVVAGGAGVSGNVYTGGAFVGNGAGLSTIPVGALVSSTITFNASNNVVVSNSGVIGLGGTVNIYSTDTFSTVTARGATTSTAVSVNNTLAAGNTTITGFVNASANVVGSRLVSTVADGTAPLVVTSTTKVTNLNADLLDGVTSTQFVRSDSTSTADIFGLASFTKTLTINTTWVDTGIIGSDMTTGSYMVQLAADDRAVGGSNNQIYTGMVSWYGATTNETTADEIVLHSTGDTTHGESLYLRTLRQSGGYIKLQISGTYIGSGTASYNFKFRRLI